MTDRAPAGWYRERDQARYWDGEAWTDRFRALPPPRPSPLAAEIAEYPPSQPQAGVETSASPAAPLAGRPGNSGPIQELSAAWGRLSTGGRRLTVVILVVAVAVTAAVIGSAYTRRPSSALARWEKVQAPLDAAVGDSVVVLASATLAHEVASTAAVCATLTRQASDALASPDAPDLRLAGLHRTAYSTVLELARDCSTGSSDGFQRAISLLARAKPEFQALNDRMQALNLNAPPGA